MDYPQYESFGWLEDDIENQHLTERQRWITAELANGPSH